MSCISSPKAVAWSPALVPTPARNTGWNESAELFRLTHALEREDLFPQREGVTTVLQAGKEFKVLAKNQLEGQHMASAAVDGNAILLRTDKALYRIETE